MMFKRCLLCKTYVDFRLDLVEDSCLAIVLGKIVQSRSLVRVAVEQIPTERARW